MKYSYITPRKKSAFTTEIQLLLLFFSITLGMLFITYLFLLFKDYSFIEDMNEIALTQSELSIEVSQMKEQIKFIMKYMKLEVKPLFKNV